MALTESVLHLAGLQLRPTFFRVAPVDECILLEAAKAPLVCRPTLDRQSTLYRDNRLDMIAYRDLPHIANYQLESRVVAIVSRHIWGERSCWTSSTLG